MPFARIRDIVGAALLERDPSAGATAREVWNELAGAYPELTALTASTRFVRNGALVEPGAVLTEGDELGLLPPYGGG